MDIDSLPHIRPGNIENSFFFRKYNGKSQEGRKFKGRIGFWTLRPTEIGRGS